MAKAILGHVGGPDPRLMAEVARLRRRVGELDAEVARLTAENQALLTESLHESLSDSLGDSLGDPLGESMGETMGDGVPDDIITLDASRPEHSAPALA